MRTLYLLRPHGTAGIVGEQLVVRSEVEDLGRCTDLQRLGTRNCPDLSDTPSNFIDPPQAAINARLESTFFRPSGRQRQTVLLVVPRPL